MTTKKIVIICVIIFFIGLTISPEKNSANVLIFLYFIFFMYLFIRHFRQNKKIKPTLSRMNKLMKQLKEHRYNDFWADASYTVTTLMKSKRYKEAFEISVIGLYLDLSGLNTNIQQGLLHVSNFSIIMPSPIFVNCIKKSLKERGFDENDFMKESSNIKNVPELLFYYFSFENVRKIINILITVKTDVYLSSNGFAKIVQLFPRNKPPKDNALFL